MRGFLEGRTRWRGRRWRRFRRWRVLGSWQGLWGRLEGGRLVCWGWGERKGGGGGRSTGFGGEADDCFGGVRGG